MLIELHYLPNITYFSLLKKQKVVFLEGNENFRKQSYRNRCKILGAQKIQQLIIPVHYSNKNKQIKNVRIDNSQKWNNVHKRAIMAAYGKAPFFDFFWPELMPLYDRKFDLLYDFNLALLYKISNLLRLGIEFAETKEYNEFPDVQDFRNRINAKGKTLRVCPLKYVQNFGKKFIPDLSIIDILMCEGPNAVSFLIEEITQE